MSEDLVLLLVRCLATPVMIFYGAQKFVDIHTYFIDAPATERFMKVFANGARSPLWFAYANALFQFGVGLAVLVGFETQIAAAFVALWFIPVTYFGHPFWAGIDPANNKEHFMNNLAIVAAYLMIAYFGAGKYSLDAMLFR
jgi:uncharacterized membrane protein YphA (DoxX/SURF4 family)